jgi:hypothetical protein
MDMIKAEPDSDTDTNQTLNEFELVHIKQEDSPDPICTPKSEFKVSFHAERNMKQERKGGNDMKWSLTHLNCSPSTAAATSNLTLFSLEFNNLHLRTPFDHLRYFYY